MDIFHICLHIIEKLIKIQCFMKKYSSLVLFHKSQTNVTKKIYSLAYGINYEIYSSLLDGMTTHPELCITNISII